MNKWNRHLKNCVHKTLKWHLHSLKWIGLFLKQLYTMKPKRISFCRFSMKKNSCKTQWPSFILSQMEFFTPILFWLVFIHLFTYYSTNKKVWNSSINAKIRVKWNRMLKPDNKDGINFFCLIWRPNQIKCGVVPIFGTIISFLL